MLTMNCHYYYHYSTYTNSGSSGISSILMITTVTIRNLVLIRLSMMIILY